MTAATETGIADGWRDENAGGGEIDLAANRAVARGLTLPHSPGANTGALWLPSFEIEEFDWCDAVAGKFERIVFSPGYSCGMPAGCCRADSLDAEDGWDQECC